jgi:hypothetical protein
MFIGHFAVGLAAKKISPKLSLGVLFVACQLLDLIWPVLVLTGIERVSVDHSATVVTPLDFSHYPYSHSLLMAVVYSLLFALLFAALLKSKKDGMIVGLVVLSHWVLDWVSHRPDLPILFNGYKVGLGMWNSIWATVLVETGLFVIGVFLYLRSTPTLVKKRKYIFWSMIIFLLIVYAGNIFGPKIPIDTHPNVIAGPALAMWLIVIWGYFADKTTSIKNQL